MIVSSTNGMGHAESGSLKHIVSPVAFGFIFAASVLAVPLCFLLGFGGLVLFLTPDVVFGPDRTGTPIVLLALSAGGVFGVSAMLFSARFLAKFKCR